MEGSVRLFRKILESQVFAHQTALKIWIWCLCKASFKERFVVIRTGKGSISVKISAGQFIFGRFKAEEELNIDGSTIYKWINKFASDEFEMIKIESNNQYSIITLCNWSEYQLPESIKEQPCNSQVTTKEQPSNTNNNVYNVYNVYYDKEIEKSQNDEQYIHVVKILFGDNNLGIPLASVLKMEDQLSYEQFKRLYYLKTKYKFSITDILEEMENWKDLKKRKTIYKTFLTFLKNKIPGIVLK
jgi:hypothetical protein